MVQSKKKKISKIYKLPASAEEEPIKKGKTHYEADELGEEEITEL